MKTRQNKNSLHFYFVLTLQSNHQDSLFLLFLQNIFLAVSPFEGHSDIVVREILAFIRTFLKH